MDLIIEQPLWFLFLCFALGGLFSLVMYRKSIRSKTDSSKIIQWLMAVTRFISVSLLAILVLNPLLKYVERTLEKPVIFIAVDNSESMVLGSDSGYVRTALNNDLSALKEALSSKYDLIELGNSQDAIKDYNDLATDLSLPFNEVKRLYDSRNVAGMVLVTDGIYNTGSNPSFASQRTNFPVFTVPVGDTTVYRDISIYSAKANAVTFLGNDFPVEVILNASKANGKNITVSVSQNGVVLDKETVKVSGSRFTHEHTFQLKATEKGNQSFTVHASYVDDELNKGNNTKMVYTDVLDVKQKVLIAAHAPHPDVSVLRNTIQDNDQYELTVEVGIFDKIDTKKYDLVITHQLPVNSYESNFLQSLKETKTPVFSIIGTQTNIDLFNRLDLGLNITGNKKNFNQGLAQINPNFPLFDPDQNLTDFLNNAPPLTTPFGEYVMSTNSDVLAFQKIGSVKTDIPLWSFSSNDGYRSGICSGEGIWRWKFNDYDENQSTKNIDALIRKTAQYLALKDDKRKFRLSTSARSFYENEAISFIGEVYNDSYELTPDATVQVNLKHADGTEFSYALLHQSGGYRYRVGALPEGKYSYSATAQFNGKKFREAGSFIVKALQLENQNLTANHNLLRQLSFESGGQSFDKGDWLKLKDEILNLPNASSITKENSRFKDLISQKWLFFLLFGLLGLEWFTRRWLGGY
jgi:hypothetical protein